VALQSDGTVIAITSSSTSENIPESSEVKWNGTDNAANARIAFDAGTADKFMVVWSNSSQSNYLYGVVGTISGSSVSFGTAQVISSSYSSNIGLTSTKANQFVVVRKDQGGSSYGIATVLDILSGTLISPGSDVTYSTANTSYNDVAADPNDDTKVVVSYDGTNQNGRARVGTVSGSSISFGTEVRFTSSVSSVYKPFIVFDKQTSGKFAIGFINNSTSYPYIVIGSYSGTTLTFGTETVTYSGGTSEMQIAADPFNADKYVVGRRDNSAGYLAVVTVSGTTPTIASYSTWTSPNGPEYIVLACDNATENKLVVGGTISSSSMKMHVGTISGTSITYGSEITFSSSNPYDTNSKTIAFNSAEDGNFAVAFLDSSDDDGRVKTGQMAFSSTNSADFVGITDQAIADTATGSVVVEGGVTEKVSGLTTGSTYYVQDDGTLSTTTSSVTAGKALSATKLLLNG